MAFRERARLNSRLCRQQPRVEKKFYLCVFMCALAAIVPSKHIPPQTTNPSLSFPELHSLLFFTLSFVWSHLALHLFLPQPSASFFVLCSMQPILTKRWKFISPESIALWFSVSFLHALMYKRLSFLKGFSDSLQE